MKRRSVLIGSGAAALALVAGGAAATRLLAFDGQSPEAEDAAYAKLLAEVHDDYVNGRVVEYEGWVLSQREFDTIANRVKKTPAPTSALT